MSLEANKALVRRWIDAYNTHNLESFDEFIASDYIDHTNQIDRDRLKQLFIMAFKAFPDWHETIDDIIAEADKVWIRISYEGTHRSEFMGIAATGKKVRSQGVDIYRIVDGKLAEYWNVTDNLFFNKQLGIIEITEQGKHLFPENET